MSPTTLTVPVDYHHGVFRFLLISCHVLMARCPILLIRLCGGATSSLIDSFKPFSYDVTGSPSTFFEHHLLYIDELTAVLIWLGDMNDFHARSLSTFWISPASSAIKLHSVGRHRNLISRIISHSNAAPSYSLRLTCNLSSFICLLSSS